MKTSLDIKILFGRLKKTSNFSILTGVNATGLVILTGVNDIDLVILTGANNTCGTEPHRCQQHQYKSPNFYNYFSAVIDTGENNPTGINDTAVANHTNIVS